MLKQSFKQQLVNCRQKLELTQEQLADLIGVGTQCIGNYEQGIRLPDLNTLARLGDVFKVDIFMRDEEVFFVEAGKIPPLFNKVDNQLAFIKEVETIQQNELPLNFGELLQRFNQRGWMMDRYDQYHTFNFSRDYTNYLQEHLKEKLSWDSYDEMRRLLRNQSPLNLTICDQGIYRPAYQNKIYLTFEKPEQIQKLQQQVVDFEFHRLLYLKNSKALTVNELHDQIFQALTFALSGFTIESIRTDELNLETTMTFKSQLTAKRLEKGLTQEGLSQLLKNHPLSAQAISYYENGDREPSLEKIVELGQVLGCEIVIRQGGYFCFYEQDTVPLFFTPEAHTETLKRQLEGITIKSPDDVWTTLDERNFVSQGYARYYSNYLRPRSYKEFYRNHAGQPWTPKLKQALIESFKGQLMDELWITDTASKTEVFTTGFRFIYKNPEEAYKSQQDGLIELIEWAESLYPDGDYVLDTIHQSFFEVFGWIIAEHKVERVEIIS